MILCLLVLVVSKFYFAPHGSVLYSVLQPLAAKLILNDTFVAVVRWLYRTYRLLLRKKATVRLFIATDDPHSYMLLQALPLVTDRFCDLEICVCVVALGMSSWSIGKEKQLKWAIKDCSLFAALYDLLPPVISTLRGADGEPMGLHHTKFGDDGLPVDAAVRELLERVNLRTAQQVLSTQQSGNKDEQASSMRTALACMHSLWGGESAMWASDEPSSPRARRYNLRSSFGNVVDADLPASLSPAPAADSPMSNDSDKQQLQAVIDSNTALLRRLGYYGPGIIEFEGEWYQLGRLHHLGHRLESDDTIQQRCDAAKGRQDGHGGDSVRTAPTSRRPHFCRELEGHDALYEHYGGGHACAARINPTPEAEAQHVSEGARQVPGRDGKPGKRTTSGSGHLDESDGSIPDVEVFYSFRSPYSQLVLDRLQRLCDVYAVGRNEKNAGDRGLPRKINIAVRPLMPMVMRGHSIPLSKAMFIIADCGREARYWGLPFGHICDPVTPDGKPVLRAVDGFAFAQSQGRAVPYVETFGRLVFGGGVDVGTDYGLRRVMLESGIAAEAVESFLTAQAAHRRAEHVAANSAAAAAAVVAAAEASRVALTQANRDFLQQRAGLWGVPCIRYRNIIVFGQDKLWVIEHALRREFGDTTDWTREDEVLWEAIVTHCSLSDT